MVKILEEWERIVPSGLINKELDAKIIEKIIKPTFKAINDMGTVYKGFLYVGLMIKNNNPYLSMSVRGNSTVF